MKQLRQQTDGATRDTRNTQKKVDAETKDVGSQMARPIHNKKQHPTQMACLLHALIFEHIRLLTNRLSFQPKSVIYVLAKAIIDLTIDPQR